MLAFIYEGWYVMYIKIFFEGPKYFSILFKLMETEIKAILVEG